MKHRFTAAIAATAAALALAACGGGGGIGGTGAATGTANFSITDAPACGYDAVNITIEKLRVHQSASARDNDAGWSEVVLNPARRVDLLSLSNGVLETLGQTELPAGTYTQLRLVLAGNGAQAPYANSVVPSGAAETPLTTPSGQQSGIKLNVDLTVEAGKVADFVLDFDACKSVVRRGNSGQYNLKPVVSVIPVISDAGLRVTGYVDPAIAFTSTNVSVQVDGVPVKATPPDATGRFVLYPVPAGTYDLVVSAAGRVTAVMTGVPVTTTAPTVVNSTTLRIAPGIAATRTVDGSVNPADATVRALQTLTGGTRVEVQWAPVDATSGDFSFTLPVQAPVKTSYVANPVSLAFAADAAAAGQYVLEAVSAGVTKTRSIDATGTVDPVSFTFP